MKRFDLIRFFSQGWQKRAVRVVYKVNPRVLRLQDVVIRHDFAFNVSHNNLRQFSLTIFHFVEALVSIL